jgi:phospholipase D
MTPLLQHPASAHFPRAALSVTYSPKGDAEAWVVAVIDGATQSVHVQAYEFSSKPICDAIVRAHQRGLEVIVLLDKANKVNPLSKWFNPVGRSSLLPVLRAAGVTVLFDTSPKIAHSKIVIADERDVCTGSFNFSAAAQHSNAENLLVIGDASVAASFESNFTWRMSLSHP